MTRRAAAVVVLLFGTAACAHGRSHPRPAGLPATSTPTTTTAPPTAPTAASGTAIADEPCNADHGSLTYRAIPVGTGVTRLGIYLPPCDPPGARHRYPTVYLLHGGGTDETQWEAIGLVRTADQLIGARAIPPIIIVVPRSGLDSGDTSIVDAVVPWVDTHLPTSASKNDRAIGGISRGAGAAFELVAEHPSLFSRLGGHSPFLESSPRVVGEIAAWGGAVWLDVGQADGLRHATEALASDLEARGAHPQLHVWPGGHDRPYWGAHLADGLRFYAAEWRPPG
jgi:enterochelin esterase-like enzyme